MKKIICMAFVCITMAVGATAQVNIVEENRNPRSECWEDSVKNNIEKGRRGDKIAFEKLAECYHEGHGVERNFINMVFMYLQASERGGLSVEEYMARYEADDPDRMLFDAMTDIDHKRFDAAEEKQERLKAANNLYHIALQMILAIERDKNEELAEQLLHEATEKDCALGEMLYVMSAGRLQKQEEYKERLRNIAHKIPAFYNLLGESYWKEGHEKDDKELVNAAINCFKEADKHACLTKANAGRLIEYYENCAKE